MRHNEDPLTKLGDHFEKYAFVYMVSGVICVEFFYFSQASEVRLLFVLLLIPIGAILGIVTPAIILLLLAFTAAISSFVLMSGAVIGIIVVLYKIVIWTNE